jgi:hypothetical protein
MSSLGDAMSSLGDAMSSLGDAMSSLGDAMSSLGDATSSLGDVQAMLTAAAVLMVGYALIDGGGLTAEDYDFGGETGSLARWVDGSLLGQLSPLSFTHGGLKVAAPCLPRAHSIESINRRRRAERKWTWWGSHAMPRHTSALSSHPRAQVIAGWFVATGMQTALHARGRRWSAHRAWAVRHVGAGLWVAGQRPLFAACRLAQVALLGPVAADAAAQADAFYTCAYLVTALYFVGAEAIARGVWRADQPADEQSA